MASAVPKARRRAVFGRDPQAYDRARLGYPTVLYDLLERRCGLGPARTVLEIGPGTGIATRELLRRGAGPMTLVEADPRLARYLSVRLRGLEGRCSVVNAAFETARLPSRSFDLVVAASSFHWLPPRRGLRKIARLLRPGGWWAAWNNHHGDPFRSSPFHAALQPLYDELRGPRRGTYDESGRARELARRESAERLRAVREVGGFERLSRADLRWTVTLPAARAVALWATFSDVATLAPRRRRRFLMAVGRLVRERFGGQVTFPMVTPLYTARRRGDVGRARPRSARARAGS